MRNPSKVIVSSVIAIVVLATSGAAFYYTHHASAQQAAKTQVATTQTENQERQKQLKDWQDKVQMWGNNGSKAQASTSSLPNTGPGQIVALFAGVSIVAGAGYSLVMGRKLRHDRV